MIFFFLFRGTSASPQSSFFIMPLSFFPPPLLLPPPLHFHNYRWELRCNQKEKRSTASVGGIVQIPFDAFWRCLHSNLDFGWMPTNEHLTFSAFGPHSGELPPTQHTPPTQSLSLSHTQASLKSGRCSIWSVVLWQPSVQLRVLGCGASGWKQKLHDSVWSFVYECRYMTKLYTCE